MRGGSNNTYKQYFSRDNMIQKDRFVRGSESYVNKYTHTKILDYNYMLHLHKFE